MPQFTVREILDALKDVKVDDKPFISDALRNAIENDTKAPQLRIHSETWETREEGRFADVKTSSQLIDLIAGIYTNYFVQTEPFCNEQTLIENLLTKQGFHRKNGTHSMNSSCQNIGASNVRYFKNCPIFEYSHN